MIVHLGILIFLAAKGNGKIEEGSFVADRFEKVLRSKTYTDKTGFIKVFLESADPLYITAPPGFGKSTVMDMIRTFIEIKVDSNGTRVDSVTTTNFNIFLDKQLEVTHDRRFYDEHCGQYPVLHLQFKFLISGNSRSEFERFLRAIIAVAAKEHVYLAHSTKLSSSQRSLYKQIYENNFQSSPENHIKDLTALLHAHHKQKCIVLIDDFDSVLSQILSSKRLPIGDVVEILTILQQILTTVMKDNEHLKNGLVTACVRMVPSSSSSNTVSSPPAIMNGVRTITFGEQEGIAKYFGFSKDEVTELAFNFGKNNKIDLITKWYGGYAVHNSKLKLYNMHSVLQYLETGNLSVYFSEADDTDSLKYMFEYGIVGDDVQNSLSRSAIRIMLNSHPLQIFSIDAVHELAKQVNSYSKSNGTSDVDRTDLFLKYLIDHGYYSIWQKTRNLDDQVVSAVIPNLETRSELEWYIFEPFFYRRKYGIPAAVEKEFISSILELTYQETGYTNFAKAIASLYGNVTTIADAPEIIRMFSIFADYSRKFEFVMRQFLLDSKEGVNLVIITKKTAEPKVSATGILIRINIRQYSALEALKEIVDRKYYNIFEDELKQYPIKIKILIGVHISNNKTCSLSYLDNSIYISEARSKSS